MNNHTRRKDPKNALYLRMARAAEVIQPKVIVVENVAQVQLDEADVVKIASEALIEAGYTVAGTQVKKGPYPPVAALLMTGGHKA